MKDNKKMEKSKSNKPENLFNAFNMVLKAVRGSEMSEDYLRTCKTPLNYLSQRLGLTAQQVSLLAIIMEECHHGGVGIYEISFFLGTSNLAVMGFSGDFDVLKEKRLIRENTQDGGVGYFVPKDVISAFEKDECYAYQPIQCVSNNDLFYAMDDLMDLLTNKEIDIVTFRDEVICMLKSNQELDLAKKLLSYRRHLNEGEFFTLIGFVMFWFYQENSELELRRLRFLLNDRREYSQITDGLTEGTSALMKRGYVQIADSDGFAVRNLYKLTDAFKGKMRPKNALKGIDLGQDCHIKSHKEFASKPMFYNPGEEEQVKRLKQLLAPKQTDAILERLRMRNMRGGFTALLYGGPGTGKTETVQQLARESGRDLFVVEVSQLRNKWYGESEKLVKGLFDDYRKVVKHSKVAPILFFNECDAIFNNRIEHAERSVDKAENALQNIILQEMETLDGVLIATTNLATSLDSAFERRFLYKIKLTKPQATVKGKIWKTMMKDLNAQEAELLARSYDFSGGQIENVSRKCTIEELMTGEKTSIKMLRTFCDEELIQSHTTKIGF